MTYRAKTRNWNGKKSVAVILNFVAKIMGATTYKSECDHDHKYYLTTDSSLRAWLIWLLFLAISPLSGGWTYILCGMANVDGNYKAIYR